MDVLLESWPVYLKQPLQKLKNVQKCDTTRLTSVFDA